jgi:polygalacturonase
MILARTATRIVAFLFLFVLNPHTCILASDTPTPGAAPKPATYNVRTFGATGEGKVKDTAALQKALDACAAAGGGTVFVPAGVYLIGSVRIRSNTTLDLDSKASLVGSPDIEDYPLARVRWEGEFAQGHRALLWAEQASEVAIVGPGSIFGPPFSLSQLRTPRGPVLIELSECTNVRLEGFTTQYERLWSIHPVLCQNVTARNLIVRSVGVNGDGIDVDSCREVTIEHCSIDTGDDAIVLKSGRGLEAVRTGRPTENVLIKDCIISSSLFAGVAIGTELSGGIRNVRIQNCTISGRSNGIFIKSREGRGAVVENITGENLVIVNAPTFLCIDLLSHGIQASEPVLDTVERWTQLRNLRFAGIRIYNVKKLVLATKIHAARPLRGLVLADIQGTCEQAISLAHASDVALSGIAVSGFQGPLVTADDVQGTGLDLPVNK